MTLTYVPNYFDILPMYMVILVMLPGIMALSRLHIGAVFAAMVAVWLAAQSALWGALGTSFGGINFPAEPWSARQWYFNPFGWQLIFFSGFAFMRGWIPAPPVRVWLIVLTSAILLANVPLSNIGVRELGLDWARNWRIANTDWFDKSDFGLLRFVHFLALAYLAYVVAGPMGARLRPEGSGAAARAWALVVRLTTKVGQQSLAVFLFSMVFARFSGFVMDQVGRTTLTMVAANFIGFGALICVAYSVGWFKSSPWKQVTR
jgi:hypothetical protein